MNAFSRVVEPYYGPNENFLALNQRSVDQSRVNLAFSKHQKENGFRGMRAARDQMPFLKGSRLSNDGKTTMFRQIWQASGSHFLGGKGK